MEIKVLIMYLKNLSENIRIEIIYIRKDVDSVDDINITIPKITCEKCGKIEDSKVKCYISHIGWKSYILCSNCVENIINYIDNTKKITVEEIKDMQNSIKLDETIDAIELIKNTIRK